MEVAAGRLWAINAGRKANSTRLRLVLFYSFLPALLVLLIPNTTADHPITYTNMHLELPTAHTVMSCDPNVAVLSVFC